MIETHTLSLTQAFGQQIAYKFIVVSHMEDAVDAWGHQLLLGVSKVTHHILRNKDDAALPVDDKEKPIKGLNGKENERGKKIRLWVKIFCLCDCACIVHL